MRRTYKTIIIQLESGETKMEKNREAIKDRVYYWTVKKEVAWLEDYT